ncbi:uncharacterized protein N7511_005333 [Penicillium nucicola]|uniref:uncharacterized protein n=1 Tax=Penicillium nucicola TaxID=1850975 RepID=UPI002545922B|nr:uncharacterized protein N7511_005333 [Penicillium nucicola]KAJ5761951.1 hypothetical protein N7511_005333 [Penicillium nucicola]
MSAKRRTGPGKRVTFALPNDEATDPAPTSAPTASPSTRNSLGKPASGHVPAKKTFWHPFSEQDRIVIRNGYQPQWATKSPTSEEPPAKDRAKAAANASKEAVDKAAPSLSSASYPSKGANNPTKSRMAEPRARVARHKGQMNFPAELRLLLLAYGDPSPHPSFSSEPLPETVRVLDEIVTDFVLEVCHGAAQVAHHARRQKIKVEDFRFALRRDPNKLGRVQELLRMERELKEARKAFDQNDDQVAKDAGKKGAAAAAAAAAAGEDPEAAEAAATAGALKKAKGKGKRGAGPRRGSDATEESVSKKRKTLN